VLIQVGGPDPTILVDQWDIPSLTPQLRINIKTALLKTDAAYWRAPYDPAGSREQAKTIQQGFSDIAEILFGASILTPEILQNELPSFVQRSGAVAGWTTAMSTSKYPRLFFRGEISEWRGRLLEGGTDKEREQHREPLQTPRDLADRYLNNPSQEKIVKLDVCWAAKQHYREWTRWLNGDLKPGSKPDRAFRAITTSGKRPEQYRSEPRPKGWK